ncbi:MAG TPA: hypothetical protein VGQ19_20905 [Burkholderiales bacterium]|jgi:hypothetical protein|nr:hypothetical protein [Burkholderiales bacterium]
MFRYGGKFYDAAARCPGGSRHQREEDMEAAAFASREGALDFSRVGAQTRGLDKIIAGTLYGAMIQAAHAGNGALQQIGAAPGKLSTKA